MENITTRDNSSFPNSALNQLQTLRTIVVINDLVLDLLMAVNEPAIISEDILNLDPRIKRIASDAKIDLKFGSLLLELINNFSGILVNTGIKERWLIIPKHYLNARKLNIFVGDTSTEHIAKIIGSNGDNAKRMISIINRIKNGAYESTTILNFKQRKRKENDK